MSCWLPCRALFSNASLWPLLAGSSAAGLRVCCVRRLGPHLLRDLDIVLTVTFQR